MDMPQEYFVIKLGSRSLVRRIKSRKSNHSSDLPTDDMMKSSFISAARAPTGLRARALFSTKSLGPIAHPRNGYDETTAFL
jgi:hypothetical protein